MFNWSFALFLIAIVAGILGFSGVAGSAAVAAQIAFFVALALAIITLISGRRLGI